MSKEKINKIPENWVEIKMADVVKINPPKPKLKLPNNSYCSFLPMSMVNPITGLIEQLEERTFENIKTGYTYFEENDILFAKITPCMENGNIVIAQNLKNGFGFGSTEFYVLRTSDYIDKKFLYYLLRSKDFRRQAQMKMTGAVGQQRVPKNYLENYKLQLPPLGEQKRIAKSIESFLNEIDNATRLIEEIMTSFNLRRLALFNKAFRGDLINTDKKKKRVEINKQITLDIPIDWVVKSFNEIVDSFNNQRSPVSQSKREEMKGDTPYYGATGVVDYIDGYTHEGEFLCIGEDGANLLSRAKPQAFIIKGKSWVNNHAHVVRANLEISNDYLMHYMNFIPLNDYITGTAQPKLNKRNLDKILVVIPPVNEQVMIIKKINNLLDKEKEVLNNCRDVISIIDELKSSILNKAFRGELGTNDLTEGIMLESLKKSI